MGGWAGGRVVGKFRMEVVMMPITVMNIVYDNGEKCNDEYWNDFVIMNSVITNTTMKVIMLNSVI